MAALSAAMAIAAVPVSCNLLEMHGGGGSPRTGIERKDSTNVPDTVSKGVLYDTLIYAAGVRFPDGYDWQADTLAATEKGELVLYRNAELIQSIPVGYPYRVSADPDRYRIADGHLYSDFYTDTETIVKKDGEELFRYPGCEIMCGFAVDGDDVWTLGQDRSGQGLSLRKNGTAVYSHDTGTVIGNMSDTFNEAGALSFQGTQPSFFFYCSILGMGPVSRSVKCYHVMDGDAVELDTPSGFLRILDAKLVDGTPVLVGQAGTSTGILSVVRRGSAVTYSLAGYDKIGSCRITPAGGSDIILSGECYSSGLMSGYILDSHGSNLFYDLEGRLVGFYFSSDMDVILSCYSGGQNLVITTNGRSRTIQGQYLYISTRSGFLLDRLFYLGLNPRDEGRPYVLAGSRKMMLDFNGFISEVRVDIVERKQQK